MIFSRSYDVPEVLKQGNTVLKPELLGAWFNKEEIDAVNRYNERFISRNDILESFEARVVQGEDCLSLKEIADQLGLGELKNADRRAIRDWMTKHEFREVSHSNVKKYYVTIVPELRPTAGATRPIDQLKNNFGGAINRIDILKSHSKKGVTDA